MNKGAFLPAAASLAASDSSLPLSTVRTTAPSRLIASNFIRLALSGANIVAAIRRLRAAHAIHRPVAIS
jgi:hypothetical protein